MELLINSVGFFFVVFGVVGFYSAVLVLAWQRLAQIRRRVVEAERFVPGRLQFDIRESKP